MTTVEAVRNRILQLCEARNMSINRLATVCVFSFRSKPFGEILNYLTLWYNVQFDFTGNVKLDELISGKIRQSEEVDNILTALQAVYHFNFKKRDDEHYEIY